MDWQKAGIVATGTSAIIATATLLFTLCRVSTDFQNEQVRRWQEVLVYKLVESAGSNGLDFDAIRTKYTQEALTVQDLPIGKGDISEGALLYVLLQLVGKRAIIYNASNTYKVPNFRELTGPPGAAEEQIKNQHLSERMISVVTTQNCHFSRSGLLNLLVQEGFAIGPVNIILTDMIARGMLLLAGDQTLCLATGGALPPALRWNLDAK
jgi:hypothetical protein